MNLHVQDNFIFLRQIYSEHSIFNYILSFEWLKGILRPFIPSESRSGDCGLKHKIKENTCAGQLCVIIAEPR